MKCDKWSERILPRVLRMLTGALGLCVFVGFLSAQEPKPVEEKRFSCELVPGGFESKNPLPTAHDYQGSVRYALYSKEGKPLELTVITGVIAKHRNRADAEYALTDSNGKIVRADSLPQDGEEHRLKLEVPKSGLYWFEFIDKGAGWKIRAAPDLPCTLPLDRNPQYSHMGDIHRLYFYVPKGTRQIQYFSHYGAPKVLGSDGKPVQEEEVTREATNVTVQVPPGEDGQVWSITTTHIPTLWFFNIPPYVATSPEALMVPKEIAEADKLRGR